MNRINRLLIAIEEEECNLMELNLQLLTPLDQKTKTKIKENHTFIHRILMYLQSELALIYNEIYQTT